MIVLDCSAAIEIALGTHEGACLKEPLLSEELCIAPAFLRIELSSISWKHAHLSYIEQSSASMLFKDASALADVFYEDADLLDEALNESLHLAHSVYDMLYLVLARRTGATCHLR